LVTGVLSYSTFVFFSRVTVSDVHQIIPRRDVFKVFSTERIEEEVRTLYDESSITNCNYRIYKEK